MVGLTRVERMLADGGFGDGVLVGLSGDRVAVRAARDVWAGLRRQVGYRSGATPVLTDGASQQKLGKNSLPSLGLMLLPQKGLMSEVWDDVRTVFRLVGPINLCVFASEGCVKACLSRSGQSGMPPAQKAQAVRTAFVLSEPFHAGVLIGDELRRALKRHDSKVNLRLNTTSDIRWEYVAPDMVRGLADAGVLLYDYTAWRPEDRAPSHDYSLTYSAKEVSHTPDAYLTGILANGGNVAIPFAVKRGLPLPEVWNGFRVIDGDVSDERRNDPRGVVVGLRAKGFEWMRDNSAGFIRSVG